MESNTDQRSNSHRRMRLVKTSKGDPSEVGPTSTPLCGVIAIGLGDRIVVSESAEVWTIKGVMADGNIVPSPIGEISFVMIPGSDQPATAIVGYVCPRAPYELGIAEDRVWPQIRGMIAQLGYDLDGYYVSISIGGKVCYRKEFPEIALV